MSDSFKRRPEGRRSDQLRPLDIQLDVQRNAPGSVSISTGFTRVLCAASVEHRVPPWMRNQAEVRGWVTAEYGMLPGSSDRRIPRKQSSRATEIQRLIGRSLRSVTDLEALAGHTVTLDCDVMDADGGTRTASITGAWIAFHRACTKLIESGDLARMPLVDQIAAVSVGIVDGEVVLDLDYPEDKAAQVDMNIVGTADGRLIEVQGTAEGLPFSRAEMDQMMTLALAGIAELAASQRRVLGI